MRSYFWAIIAGLILCVSFDTQALAQDIVQEPICFIVRNEAPYKVYGDFRTDYYVTPEGQKAKHRSNFRLEEAGGMITVQDEAGTEREVPGDVAEFCSYGPFLPDRKLYLTLRTLIPIFSCKTKVDQGEIVIKGYRKPEGGTETWAECYQ